MRTHPNKELKFPEYEKLTAQSKAKWARMVNKDAANRAELVARKRCSPFGERGITLDELPAESTIPGIIETQGWGHFIRTPEPYDDAVVREFYMNMIPAVYHDQYTVMVRNRQVRISLDDISEYHRVPRRRNLGMYFGMSNCREFYIKENPVIAQALRRNGVAGWNRYRDEILKSEMHYDIAFMMMFVKSSLKPSTHNTTADPQVAHVLYSLQQGLPMDVAHIMWMEILDAGMGLDGILPFPCMITHFCRRAGVQLGRMTAPMGNFGKKLYQIQITAANKHDRGKTGRSTSQEQERERERLIAELQQDPNYDEEEYNFVDPEYVPDEEEEEEHTGDTPPWMTRIDNKWQQQYDDINWRLDQLGAPPISERRRVRKRPDGGASSSHDA